MDKKGVAGIWGLVATFILGFIIGAALMAQPEFRNFTLGIEKEVEETIVGPGSNSSPSITNLLNNPEKYDKEKVTVKGELRVDEDGNITLCGENNDINIINFEDAEKPSGIIENSGNFIKISGSFHAPKTIYARRIRRV